MDFIKHKGTKSPNIYRDAPGHIKNCWFGWRRF